MAIKFLSGLNLSGITTGSLLKLDSNGDIVAAVAGTDYAASSSTVWSTSGSNPTTAYYNGRVRVGTYQASVEASAKLHVFDYQTTDPKLLIEDGNTGDASMQFKISTKSYVMGIDNSDSDVFKFSASSAFDTTNVFTVNTSGNVTFASDVYNAGIIRTRNNNYGVLSTYGSEGFSYEPVESTNTQVRYWLRFDYTNNASYPYLTNRTPNGAVVIKTGTAGGSGENEHFRIKGGDGTVDAYFTNVNLGIGTTSPGGVFDVQKSSSGNILARVWNTNTVGTGSSSIRIANSANNSYGSRLEFTDNDYYVATISGDRTQGLVFRTSATGTSPTGISEWMRITTAGNVGIGTTNPVQKLQVDGNIYSNGGNIYVNTGKGLYAVGELTLNSNNGSNYVQGIKLNTNGTLVFAQYGAGILKTDSSGNVSLDTNTYLTTTSASSTYLPLTGGTVANGNTAIPLTISRTSATSLQVGIRFLATDGESEPTDQYFGAGTDQEPYWATTANLSVGNMIWHEGNDGATSGLDADLLDGQHGSYYLDYNNFTNTPTISESDTLDSVTDRGATTTNTITIQGGWASTILTGDNVILKKPNYSGGGWARTLLNFQEYDATSLFQIGGYGSNNTMSYGYLGSAYNTPTFRWYADKKVVFDGNVGIGTTSPDQKLQVSGSDSVGIRISGGTNNRFVDLTGTSLNFYTTSTGGWAMGDIVRKNSDGSVLGYISGGYGDPNTLIYTYYGGTAYNSAAMYILSSNNNVGIGTANPTRKLHVSAGATVAALFDSTQDYILGLARSGTEEWWLKTYTDGRFALHENGVGDKLTIKAGGNVGIGTTAPGHKLEVNGTTHLGTSATSYTRFGTYGVLLSTDTHILHNMYYNNAWYQIDNTKSSSTIYMGSSSDNTIKFGYAGAGSTTWGYKHTFYNDGDYTAAKDVTVGAILYTATVKTTNAATVIDNSGIQPDQGTVEDIVKFKWSGTQVASVDTGGYINATGFKTSGTTGFLKSDGSVDTSSYISSIPSEYVTDTELTTALGSYLTTSSFNSAVAFVLNGTDVTMGDDVTLGSAAFSATTDFAAASHTHSYLPLSGGTLTGTLIVPTIEDSLYNHGGSDAWYTKRYTRNLGISGSAIGDSWVHLARIAIGNTYHKLVVKFTIHGFDDVSSGTEVIDGRYENGSAAQEAHSLEWYSTDNNANLFKEVRSIRSSSSGLSNTYDIWVQMAGDWRDTFTVDAEYWTYGGGITFMTTSATATEPSAGSDDKQLTSRTWRTQNAYMYLGGNRILTTADVGTAASSAATDFVAVTGDTMTGQLLLSDATASTGLYITSNTASGNGAVLRLNKSAADKQVYQTFESDTLYLGVAASQTTVADIGTKGGVSLDLNTNYTTRMRIGSNGDISVGSTNAWSKFTVYASTHSNGISVSRQADNTAALYIGNDGGSTPIIASNNADLIFGRDFSGTFTERMRMTNGGNFGIGTTSPSNTLDVLGKVKIDVDGTYGGGYGTIGFGGTTNGYNRVFGNNSTGDGLFLASATGTGIYFRANGGATDHMAVASSGNVGIGTTSPSYKLDVNGTVRASGQITASSDVYLNGGGIIKLTAGANAVSGFTVYNAAENGYLSNRITTDGHSRGWGWELTNSTANSATVSVYHRFGYGSSATTYLANGTGNVGIGTVSPAEKLHVAGNIKTSGELIFDTSAATTTSTAKIFFGTVPSPDGSLNTSLNNVSGYGVDNYGIILQSGYGDSDMGGIKITDDGVMVWGASDENVFTVIDEDGNTVKFSIDNSGQAYVNGNLGVGTTSPSSKLHVEGGVTITGDTLSTGGLFFRNDTSGDGAIIRDIDWRSTAANGTDDRLAVIRAITSAGTATTRGGQLNFYTRQANSDNFNTMVYDRSGNLYVPSNVYSNSSQLATQSYVDTAVANLVDQAPQALDTLSELAAALGDDAAFSTTVSTALGNRLRIDTNAQNLTATEKSNAYTNLDLANNFLPLSGVVLTVNGTDYSAGDELGAADLLAKIKTVDGSTSGLDADTLDGIDSGSFLRSDANDTYTGTLTVSGTVALGELRMGTHAVHSGYTGLWNTEASTGTTQQYMIISAGTDTYINGDSVYIRGGNNSTTNELKVSTSGVTVGGNKVLTESADLTTYNINPAANTTYDLGRDSGRWRIVYCETLDSAGIHEANLANKKTGLYATGTVLVWKDGQAIPSTSFADYMKIGIAVYGNSSPLVHGAEPVLCTGQVEEGDYLVTSTETGHAMALTRQEVRERNLMDCVIGKALESGDGKSHLIKTWLTI